MQVADGYRRSFTRESHVTQRKVSAKYHLTACQASVAEVMQQIFRQVNLFFAAPRGWGNTSHRILLGMRPCI